MKNGLLYILGIVVTVAASSLLGLTTTQLAAVAGFSSIFFGAIFFWQSRLTFAFFGVAFLMATGLTNVQHVVEFAGLDIVLFLIGMMIIVGYLEEKSFFEHLINKLISLVGMDGRRLVILLVVMSAVSAALIDEVTSVLFMAAAVLSIASRHKLNPVPFLIMVVFATNIGSSATVVGNPIGVIIALRSGLTFVDFLRWAAPISLAVLLMTIVLFFIYYAKPIRQLHEALKTHKYEPRIFSEAGSEKKFHRGIMVSGILFACVVVGLVLHVHVEKLMGLEKNTMLLGTALLGGAVALFLSKDQARNIIERKIDWWTLCFFLFLFASVGTLKYQGITGVLAQKIAVTAGNNVPFLMGICVWSSGALTSVMDNVLAVSTFVPIIKDIGAMGIPTFPLWWSILFGSTLLGNLTIIGSTANIVAIGVMEKRKLGTVSFMEWLKVGAAIAIPELLLAHMLLLAQLKYMPK
ncbi:MAG: SLC13 family permease [Candidatus Omnitrophica bacterium]|nr:SLC13 family permease [Candidatus Omnitrophota bacterium]